MTQLGMHTWNELCSQPAAWRAALDVVIGHAPIIASHRALTKASHIIWSGCGSPYYLAVAAARITQQHDPRPSYAIPASEIWLNPSASIPRDATPTLILLSRSGSTTEVLRAAAQFRQSAPNGHIITITCYPDRPLASVGDINIIVPSGQEQSLAQTRAFTVMQMGALGVIWLLSGRSLTELSGLPDVAADVKKIPDVVSVIRKAEQKGFREFTVFPHNNSYAWNNDFFGPLIIPKAGMTLPIDTHNLCLYKKILDTYDDGIHQVISQNGQVLYDQKPISSYKFKQDYYFMMGDNRHNSADSRSWGMVPYDHIVGSPFFVWFSMKYSENNPVSGKSVISSLFKNSKDGKFRWERFLCYVDDGNLHSIKIPFILSVLGIWGINKWNNRRKLKLKNKST